MQNGILGGYSVVITTKTVQRRRHKKKRINKKWRKRYGCIVRDVQDRGDTLMDHENKIIYMSQATYCDLVILAKTT